MKNNTLAKLKYIYIILLSCFIIIIDNVNKYSLKVISDYSKNTEEYKKNVNTIYYKGKNILKSKLIDDFLSMISDDYISYKKIEKHFINIFFNYPLYSDDPLFKSDFRKKFLNYVSQIKNKTINQIDVFFITRMENFGNNLIIINNCIFYCEIVGCRNIILNKNIHSRNWMIKDPIFIQKLNITITQGSNVLCEKDDVLCINMKKISFFFPIITLPKISFDYIKTEIIRNLPKVNTEPDSLYIHLRGGDAFIAKPHICYAQPPLCFYEKIINNNKFKNIYIISIDNRNIIIDHIKNKYNNVIHNNNSLQIDISLLVNAYNIVLSVSTFSISSIKLNENLKDIWEFDMIRLSQKIKFLHHDFYEFKRQYKIHSMKPTSVYISKMFIWQNSIEQTKLMLEYNCPNDFEIRIPNI